MCEREQLEWSQTDRISTVDYTVFQRGTVYTVQSTYGIVRQQQPNTLSIKHTR